MINLEIYQSVKTPSQGTTNDFISKKSWTPHIQPCRERNEMLQAVSKARAYGPNKHYLTNMKQKY